MKQYCVQVIEIYRQDVLVDAADENEAIKKVENNEGVDGDLHYTYTVEPEEWIVFEVK